MLSRFASTCPECKNKIAVGASIVKRDGHWAHETCPTIPQVAKSLAKADYTLSPYQTDIIDWAKSGSGNVIVKATAGSGKTFTCTLAIMAIEPALSVWYGVFNSANAREAQGKITRANTSVTTLHSKGLGDIRKVYPKCKIDENKTLAIIDELPKSALIDDNRETMRRLVSLYKDTLLPVSDVNTQYLCDTFAVAVTNGETSDITTVVAQVLKLSVSKEWLNTVDFSDMIYYPACGIVPASQYDVVVIDESQDLNQSQIELVCKSVKHDGRVMAVGDDWQAIYAWRGADSNAIATLQSRLSARTLPLSISYRCPSSHVALARKVSGNDAIESSPSAKVGTIENVGSSVMVDKVQSGDLVICRTNAPLVEPAFAVIRSGRKAIIRGRNIGQGLVTLVKKIAKKSHVDDLRDILVSLHDYSEKEIAKLERTGRTKAAELLQDQVDTIMALSDGLDTLPELTTRIDVIFSDKDDGVIFSSIHRAKGAESNTVYILNPSLMPHKMAKSPEAIKQEYNCIFVAYTRSKDKLYLVQ